MDVKILEVRDRATFIPVMAVRLLACDESELYLLQRAGYSRDQIITYREGSPMYDEEPYIILVKLDGVEAHYDSFDWPNQRTMGAAHRWVIEHWAEVKSGDVVDVEHILGEKPTPKLSERITCPL